MTQFSEADPTEADFIRAVVRDELSNFQTMVPAVVEAYDAAKRQVLVRPVVRGRLPGDTISDPDDPTLALGVELPPIHATPVVFEGGGGFSSRPPLVPGDAGLLVMSSHDFSQWQSTGTTGLRAQTGRKNSLNDAVFFPLIKSDADILANAAAEAKTHLPLDWVTAVPAGRFMVWGDNTVVTMLARADKVDAELAKLKTALDARKAEYDAHTHTHSLGPGTTAPPVPPFTAAAALVPTPSEIHKSK